jgi:hypothetical protein
MNKKLLKEEFIKAGYSCLLVKENEKFFSYEKGVKPLFVFLKSGKDFTSFLAYDKVVGKATAFLYILLKVKEVNALVISEPAYNLLKENNIKVEYSKKVENIINRKGDDLCPFEKLVLEIEEPKTALELITKQLKEFGII